MPKRTHWLCSSLGAVISSKRREKGLTITELSNILSMAPANVRAHETGRYAPTVATLTEYAHAFDMRVSDMVRLAEELRERSAEARTLSMFAEEG